MSIVLAAFAYASPASADSENAPIVRSFALELHADGGTLLTDARNGSVTFHRDGSARVKATIADRSTDGWCPYFEVTSYSTVPVRLPDARPAFWFCNPKTGTTGRSKTFEAELPRSAGERIEWAQVTVGRLYCHDNQWTPVLLPESAAREYDCPPPSTQLDFGDDTTLAAYVQDGRPRVRNGRCEVRELCLYEHSHYRGRVYDIPDSDLRVTRALPGSMRDEVSSWSNGIRRTLCATSGWSGLFTLWPARRDPPGVGFHGRDGWVGAAANDRMDEVGPFGCPRNG
jgi:hypothetical protein